MNIVKVKQSFYDLLIENHLDKEILTNKEGRPCVLVVRLKYRGITSDFVVPIRSNISPTTPYDQYLCLPPNRNTRSRYRHGVHYIKLFPIDSSKYIDKYHFLPSDHFSKAVSVMEAHEKVIISACQTYLSKYEAGQRNAYTPDIDGILRLLLSQ